MSFRTNRERDEENAEELFKRMMRLGEAAQANMTPSQISERLAFQARMAGLQEALMFGTSPACRRFQVALEKLQGVQVRINTAALDLVERYTDAPEIAYEIIAANNERQLTFLLEQEKVITEALTVG